MTKWKPWLSQLRRDLIISPLQNDRRSTSDKLLGKSMDWIFNVAINGGQADFDQCIDDLTPRDRAMLYAYANQKTHIDELIHAFEKFLANPGYIDNATVLDIGCGPFTAGLAFANIVETSFPYRYFGIDHANSMIDFGDELAQEAIARGYMHIDSKIDFANDLSTVDFGPLRAAETTVVVLSFLLASESIDVRKLVDDIVSACNRIALGRVIVLYTNSARESARRNFAPFKTEMMQNDFHLKIEEVEQFEDTAKPRPIHYAVFIRNPISLPISEF